MDACHTRGTLQINGLPGEHHAARARLPAKYDQRQGGSAAQPKSRVQRTSHSLGSATAGT
eukprot:6206842-Pleurochrysis_carterae.AAC.2